MKDERDILIEISGLESWLTLKLERHLSNTIDVNLILTLKTKIEMLKWVLDEI